MNKKILFGTAMGIFLLFGCSQQQNAATTPSTATSQTSGNGTQIAAPVNPETNMSRESVAISGFKFDPPSLTVAPGTIVTWTNKDSVSHNVIADSGTFSSETLTQGKSFSYIFEKPGTYSYVCTFHPGMKATVTVK